jgi:dihydrofolate reductase
MPRIVMFNRVSADGYFSDTDGNLNWVVPDEELDQAGADAGPDFDTIVFGRRTYEMFAAFWPHAGDEWPHASGRHSPAIRTMATFLNETRKLVLSRTLATASWQNSHVLRSIDEIRAQRGQNMIVFGSGSLVSQMSERGLIDEYHIIVSPVFLGNGRPLISGVPSAKLELMEAKGYRSGNVSLRWRSSPN